MFRFPIHFKSTPRSKTIPLLGSVAMALALFSAVPGQCQSVLPLAVKVTEKVLQKDSSKHLEKLRALEVMAEEYRASSPADQMNMPPLYKLAHDAFVFHDTDAVLELAYASKGLGGHLAPDTTLALDILSPHMNNPKVRALKDFLLVRSVTNAQAMLQEADSEVSKAVGYMALADAYYATNNPSKAILFATLSLAYSYSSPREEQAKYYLTGRDDSPISLHGSRDEVLARLNEAMEGILDPHAFRRYFSMASVIGLLPSYPLSADIVDSAEPVNLCMAFDDRFAPHGAVTILSAMLSAEPTTKYVFHVMEDIERPLNDDFKDRLCDMVNEMDGQRFEINFEPVDKAQLPPIFQEVKKFRHWPRLVFYKLYIPETFPDLDRILWLDADLIVKEDLSVLYDSPLEGKWFAGVRDYGGDNIQSYLPLPDKAAYLNVGVLLYNISAINDEKGCDRVAEYCEKHPGFEGTLKYPEQDMLALIYPDEILELEHQEPKHLPDGTIQNPRWNWFYLTDNDTHWKRVHDHSAGIIHMAGGGLKPWRRKFSPTLWSWVPKRNDGVQSLYWALRDMGPWSTR